MEGCGRKTQSYRKIFKDAFGMEPAAEILRFDADPKGRRWVLLDSYCPNPHCKHEEITALLIPDLPREEAEREKLYFRVNLKEGGVAWDERPSAEAEAIALEFAGERRIQRLILRRRHIVRASGLLEGAAPIAGDPGMTWALHDFSPIDESFPLRFECDGKDWDALDQYCVNPECDCEDAILIFYQIRKDRKIQEEEFGVQLDLTTGEVRHEDNRRLSRGRIRVLERFQIELGDWRGELSRRRDLLRRIARRHLALEAPPWEEPIPETVPFLRAEKVGRNAPCPCGSGRKFKNCCGRAAGTPGRA